MACDDKQVVVSSSGERFLVPCGKCPPCKLRRIQGWVFRLQKEEERSLCAHFVTLTYDTTQVPITEHGFMSLHKPDLQRFFKKLRKIKGNYNVKYYAAGEYGSIRKRPHYHAIIFNVENSEDYARAWSIDGVQIGSIQVGTVTSASIAYTLKYIDKPHEPRRYTRDDRQREFSLMSKGLGDNYITEQSIKYHQSDLQNNFLTERGGKKIALPKYYREKLFTKEQLKEQTIKIIQITEQQLKDDRVKYHNHHPGTTEDDWHLFRGNQRAERHRRYYYRQKPRSAD